MNTIKTSPDIFSELQKLHDKYMEVVVDSGIKPLSVKMYLQHSHNFIRWVADDFKPGEHIKNR